MSAVRFPPGYRIEPLHRDHQRSAFCSGQAQVDDWLTTKALQSQEKHLSATKVLIDPIGTIAGFYTLSTAQVDFSDLPPDISRRLPRRSLPVAILAWLGVRSTDQGHGLGRRLLAQVLRDSYDAGQTFPFVAVIVDCINDEARTFYPQWDFRPLSGHNNKLFLSWRQLQAMVTDR
jgi:GNAT superfamily N-acetyltransferase